MVKVRKHKRGWWQVDIRLRGADGTWFRERLKSTASGRNAAMRWGEERERFILANGQDKPMKEVPTLEAFWPRFIENYAVANRQKPSEIKTKETHLKTHLVPALGKKRLDAITVEDVQAIKTRLKDRSAKLTNNVLTVLGKLLKVARDWGVIDKMPCEVRLLPAPTGASSFHDFDELKRLREAAREDDPRTELVVLLGSEAGLRAGEIMALEWRDVDFNRGQLRISRSEWQGRPQGPGPARRAPRPAPHLLLAPGDAERAGADDPVARRARGPVDVDAVHALDQRRARGRDQGPPGSAAGVRGWQHDGNGRDRVG